MEEVRLLERYRRYLVTVDDYAQNIPEDEYLDLLGPGEVIDLLVVRDRLSEAQLTAQHQQELDRLDDLLVKHFRLVADNIPPYPEQPRPHWWWHLHEGPQVREEARKAA